MLQLHLPGAARPGQADMAVFVVAGVVVGVRGVGWDERFGDTRPGRERKMPSQRPMQADIGRRPRPLVSAAKDVGGRQPKRQHIAVYPAGPELGAGIDAGTAVAWVV